MHIFNKIYITLNKIFGEYAGDLNIDELKPS